MVDSGGALTLAGGAVLTAQQRAVVGRDGAGQLIVMGAALELTGSSGVAALVIGEQTTGIGRVVNLETIAASGTVTVGQAGTGTLELLGVAAVVSDGDADRRLVGRRRGQRHRQWRPVDDLRPAHRRRRGLGRAAGRRPAGRPRRPGHGLRRDDRRPSRRRGIAHARWRRAPGRRCHGLLQHPGGRWRGSGSLFIDNGGEAAIGVALATIVSGSGSSVTSSFVNDNGMLVVGAAAGGDGTVGIGTRGALLVYGDGIVGAGTGSAVVSVGGSGTQGALFALLGNLDIGSTGRVALAGEDSTIRASSFHIFAGAVVSGTGTLSGDGGGNHTVTLASIDNDGAITAVGGELLIYGNVVGSGTLSVATSATITLQSIVGSSQVLDFSADATAVLNDAGAFAGTITDFGAGDVLDLSGPDATGATWSGGVLSVDTTSGVIHLSIAGSYAANAFTVQSDGHGGTNVVLAPTGDVHMVTFDGLHYDFQAVGDFVAVRSTQPGNPWEIQIRTAAANGATSITTGLAAVLGDDRVTFAVGRDNPVYVDGAPDTLQVGASQSLAGGTLKRLSANAWRLSWNTGESVTVAERAGYDHGYFDWSVALGPQDGPRIGAGPARQQQRPGHRLPAAGRLCPGAAAQRGSDPRRLRRCLARGAGRLAVR